MTKSRLTLALLAVAAVGLLVPALSGAAATQLSAKLKGSEEVEGGDSNGKGDALVAVKKPSKGKLCFVLSWEKIGPPMAAHIHKGAPGVDGPVKVTLFEDASGLPEDSNVEACVGVSKKIAKKLRQVPEKFYVNIHNDEFPAGAIRGQLAPAS